MPKLESFAELALLDVNDRDDAAREVGMLERQQNTAKPMRVK